MMTTFTLGFVLMTTSLVGCQDSGTSSSEPRSTGASAEAAGDSADTDTTGAPDPLPPGYREFSHPLGLAFHHPKAWRVDESPLGLQLSPPGVTQNAYGPSELYLVNMIGADPSVRGIDDPRAPQMLEQLFMQTLPFLRSQGTAQRFSERSAGRRFDFAGTNPLGQQVECRVYGVLVDGYFVALTGIGERGKVSARDAELKRVAESLALGAAQGNRQLAGTWYSESSASAGSIASDRVHVNTTNTVTLLVDGRISSSAQSSVSGTVGGHDGPGASVTGVTDPSLEAGRWAVEGKTLYILWKSGGAAKFDVYVQGSPGRREILLTPAGGGKKVLWTEYRL